MASYTHPQQSQSRSSNASAESFSFDIASAITSANIPAYSKITKVTITVWGDIDTATSRGKMTASFGSQSICSDVWCGGSAGEVSRSADLNISTFFNSENANAGKLKDSSVRLNITLDGPVMVTNFNHTAKYQIYFEWTPHSHSTEVRNKVSATCTTTGYTGDTYCTVCGTKISSGTTIAALGHSYNSVVTPPTETSQGYTTHTCSRCGHSYKDSYVDPIKINKIYIGTSQPKDIYIGTTKVKAIYIGTTKVYG